MAGESQRRFLSVRPGALILASLVFAVVRCSNAQPANIRGDVFIVERPQRLLLYNKFQQPCTDQERKALPPFVPMVILKASDMLGDGFTPCMKVEIANQVYFLLRDAGGKLIGSSSSGYSRTFDRVSLLDDTLLVLAGGRLTLASPTRTASRLLKKNEQLVRAFRDGQLSYVWTSGSPPSFGWVTLREAEKGGTWNVVSATPAKNGVMPEEVGQRIESTIRETNDVLARLYQYLNAQTGDQRTIPRWTVARSGTSIVCEFSAQRLAPQFEQSSRVLERDIQALLTGTNFETVRSSGRIEIRPR